MTNVHVQSVIVIPEHKPLIHECLRMSKSWLMSDDSYAVSIWVSKRWSHFPVFTRSFYTANNNEFIHEYSNTFHDSLTSCRHMVYNISSPTSWINCLHMRRNDEGAGLHRHVCLFASEAERVFTLATSVVNHAILNRIKIRVCPPFSSLWSYESSWTDVFPRSKTVNRNSSCDWS